MKKITSLIVISIALSSCATIFTGSKAKITIDSNIKEAKSIEIDGYKHKNVSFPYIVKVKKGFNDTVIKTEAEGYNTDVTNVGKSFNAVSIINLSNLLGWGIDAATGAITKPDYKNYYIEMKKIEE